MNLQHPPDRHARHARRDGGRHACACLTGGRGLHAGGGRAHRTVGDTPSTNASNASNASAPAAATGLDDIVASARRVSENAETVPVTVSAFSADASADIGGGHLPGRIGCAGEPAGLTADSQMKGKPKAPTWTVGIDWKATDALFYAASRRGYKACGIDAPAFAPGQSLPHVRAGKDDRHRTRRQDGLPFRRCVAAVQRLRLPGEDQGIPGGRHQRGDIQLSSAGLACVGPHPAPFIDGE